MTDEDLVRQKIWDEISGSWAQLSDAMLSRLTEVMWPDGVFQNCSPPYARPSRFYPEPAIEVRDAGLKGRGIFACDYIGSGVLVETAPILARIPPGSLDCTALEDYPMEWDEYDVIALGRVQLMNHSDDPNCRLERDIEGGVIRVYTISEIHPDEELTYRYQTVWFEQ